MVFSDKSRVKSEGENILNMNFLLLGTSILAVSELSCVVFIRFLKMYQMFRNLSRLVLFLFLDNTT